MGGRLTATGVVANYCYRPQFRTIQRIRANVTNADQDSFKNFRIFEKNISIRVAGQFFESQPDRPRLIAGKSKTIL